MGNWIQETVAEASTSERLEAALQGLALIHSIRVTGQHNGRPTVEFVIDLQGRDSGSVFDEISQRFENLGYTPTLRQRDGDVILQALPVVMDKKTGKPWVNAVLFILTLLSVVFIGSVNEGGQPFANPADLVLGLPFAGTLLGILTAHELSHYFVGRRYGSPVSLPYFIPLPLNILGTMGAVITQKGPMRSRKALFDIGVAGPIGGVIVAIPLLFLGLSLSNVQPLPEAQPYYLEGNSLLYFLAKFIVFGRPLPSGGMDVMLHPVAFAAWAGLMVTALNLFPVGQFDGGHVTYAMFGKTAWTIARVFVGTMIGWGLLLTLRGNEAGWTWVVWGVLGMLMGPKHPAPLDNLTPLGSTRRLMGWGVVVLFILTLVPVPLTIVTP
jgi:membrane-associated protease RseP (regulator of RpoE activity)